MLYPDELAEAIAVLTVWSAEGLEAASATARRIADEQPENGLVPGLLAACATLLTMRQGEAGVTVDRSLRDLAEIVATARGEGQRSEG